MSNLQTVRQILIGKDAANDGDAFEDLAEGVIEVYDKDFAILAPGSTPEDSSSIYIGRGNAAGVGSRSSFEIKASEVIDWTGKSYVAGTKRKVFVGNIGSGALDLIAVEGGTYIVTVFSANPDKHRIYDKYVVQYDEGTTPTVEEIADDVVAAITNKAKKKVPVTAAKVNNGADFGFYIESDDVNEDIDVGIEEAFKGVPVTVNNLVYSFGTGAQIVQEEKDVLGYRGVTNTTHYPITPTQEADASVNYDVYLIRMRGWAQHGIEGTQTEKMVKIAIPTNAATFDRITFETTLNEWMAATPKQFAPVNL